MRGTRWRGMLRWVAGENSRLLPLELLVRQCSAFPELEQPRDLIEVICAHAASNQHGLASAAICFLFKGAECSGGIVSIVNRLERLAELLEMGALTPEEFATEKQRLLGRSANADRSSDAVEVGSGSNIYDEIGPVAVRKTPISDMPDCHVDQPDTAPSTDESKSAADRGAVNTRDGRSS